MPLEHLILIIGGVLFLNVVFFIYVARVVKANMNIIRMLEKSKQSNFVTRI